MSKPSINFSPARRSGHRIFQRPSPEKQFPSSPPHLNRRSSLDMSVRRLRKFHMKTTLQACFLTALLAVVLPTHAAEPAQALADYRAELNTCRQEHGGSSEIPDVKFFLFGMGARTKLLYRDGILLDAKTGRELYRWKVRSEVIVPSDYLVSIETEEGTVVALREDSEAVWLEQGGQRAALEGTKSLVKLPDFGGRKFPRVLRVLHQEMLVNIVEAGPVPNYFVYEKPWYRDGAMVALALKETGNLDLLKPWILGLREPFDRNNKGETEADNLGQALLLISLVSDKNHPLVAKVLAEVPRFEKTDATGKYILGRSDFSDHPVYQTKWLKYGLRALDLPDVYVIPKVADSYSALFWMDYRDQHVAGQDSDDRGAYPYLGWACDHFHETKKCPLSNRDYPLTWEERASEARYDGLQIISPAFVKMRLSPPHTWHAAEAFLLLLAERAPVPQ